eukprot:TRINITY_DN423_c0_g1_i5.p1 TRINITY_DN423_c0_g1~~TRINITY_DN423_c0_g1_i5.p1  ORF type:complete len:297 (+),score=82.79 TRINITY_DN423_c0_g1_i5:204-1094(+)
MAVFKDRYIVHLGSCTSNDTHLYHVSGFCSFGTPCAIEIPLSSTSLNSNDCFFMLNGAIMYLWTGKYASAELRESALKLSASIKGSRTVQSVEEGAEPGEFWGPLGGKKWYQSKERGTARLFACSKASGKYLAKEVFNWCQDELRTHLFMLDANYNIYVWFGKETQEDEKKRTLELAQEYHDGVKSQRNHEVACSVVPMDCEPPEFRSYFHGWILSRTCKWTEQTVLQSVARVLETYSLTYTIEELRTKPAHLDNTNLESYLSDADFEKYFGKTRQEYNKMPKWHKDKIKKDLQLY